MLKYHKRRLSPCRKKSQGADDDDWGGQELEQGRSRAGLRAGAGRAEAGEEQGRSRNWAGVG